MINLNRARDLGAVLIDRVTVPCAADEQLAIEQEIFEGMSQLPERLRLWQPLPALIATMAEANRPEFESAAVRARGRGLSVHVRGSGGGAVCVGPGSLIVSHFYCSSRNNIDSSYRQFAGMLVDAVAGLDVSLNEERVEGAYCDGRFDLAWHGRKVGGIAQRRRVRRGIAEVWIHAVLAVEASSLRHPEAVSEFYADLGSFRVADPCSTTTLFHCLPHHVTPRDLLTRVSDEIVRRFAALAPLDAPA